MQNRSWFPAGDQSHDFSSFHETFLFAAHSDALCEAEHCGGPLPWVYPDIYEANVSLSWPIPQLGCGCFSLCQHHIGIKLGRRLFYSVCGLTSNNDWKIWYLFKTLFWMIVFYSLFIFVLHCLLVKKKLTLNLKE